jgi:hypothetical protein
VFSPERNPFEVLRLDPGASEDEVVRRAGQLRRRASDEASIAELRRAVQALTARPEDRHLFAVLAHPRPGHSCVPLERLATAFRRPPAPGAEQEARLPFDFAEFAGFLAVLLAEELDTPQLSFEPVSPGDDANEIGRQSDEALWQALVIDSGA